MAGRPPDVLAYAGAPPIEGIWKGSGWINVLESMFDGLVYALVTAGTFAWLWPS